MLYYQFRFKSLSADLAEAEAEHAAEVADRTRSSTTRLPEYEELKTKNDSKLKAIIEENQKALPTEAEVPAFFETLERKVTEAGVEINKWQKKSEEPIEQFVKVPVEIEITGTFMQIKRFFASLVQKDVEPKLDDRRQRRRGARARDLDREPLAVRPHGAQPRDHPDRAVHRGDVPPGRSGSRAASAPHPHRARRRRRRPRRRCRARARRRAPRRASRDSIKKGDTVDRNATGVDEAKTPAGGGSARLKGGI